MTGGCGGGAARDCAFLCQPASSACGYRHKCVSCLSDKQADTTRVQTHTDKHRHTRTHTHTNSLSLSVTPLCFAFESALGRTPAKQQGLFFAPRWVTTSLTLQPMGRCLAKQWCFSRTRTSCSSTAVCVSQRSRERERQTDSRGQCACVYACVCVCAAYVLVLEASPSTQRQS